MDRIDYNVEQAAVKVEEGLEQLRKVGIQERPGMSEYRPLVKSSSLSQGSDDFLYQI